MTVPLELNYSISTLNTGQITSEHFGLNFVYEFESFGDRPWDRFDEVVESTGVRVIRYPGGSEAETVFDIRNPNAETATLPNGTTREVTPLNEFLAFINENNLQSVIIIPTQMALSENYVNGFRDFDETWEQDIKNFVKETIAASMPTGIQSFELGNEYQAYMTPVEYGRVASRMATIVDEAINEYWAEHQVGESIEQPNIAVQIWFDSPGEGMSIDDLITNNNRVMNEFDADEIALVDAVIGHYYYNEGLHLGEENEHGYFNIEESIQISVDLMNAWRDGGANDIEFMVSEWNVSFQGGGDTGLSQIPVLLEMFTSFVSSGVEYLDFWSAQYHSTSLAGSNGALFAAGELFALMTSNLIGTQISDISIESETLDIHAFEDDARIIMFVSSLMETEQPVSISATGWPYEYLLVSSTLISVNEQSADGSYLGTNGWPIYLEPDVEIELISTSFDGLSNDGIISFDLNAFETTMLVFYRVPPNAVLIQGTNGNDTLTGTIGNDLIIGSDGDDIFYGGAGEDVLEGGNGQDVFVFNSNSDTARIIDFDHTNDMIDLQFLLENQNGIIASIDGETFLISKEIAGDVGTAYFFDIATIGNGTLLTINSSTGETILTLELSGVLITQNPADFLSSLFFGESTNITPIETESAGFISSWAEVTIESILNFEIAQANDSNELQLAELVGPNHNLLSSLTHQNYLSGSSDQNYFSGTDTEDQIYGGNATDWLFGGSGQDYLDGGQGNDKLFGQEGSDAIFGRSGNDHIVGGDGDDILFGGTGFDLIMAGDGDDLLVGGEGDDRMEGGNGSDIFIFFSYQNNNDDYISDFNPDEDNILIYGARFSELNISSVQNGTMIAWGTNSIILDGVNLADMTEDAFLFV